MIHALLLTARQAPRYAPLRPRLFWVSALAHRQHLLDQEWVFHHAIPRGRR